MSQPDAVQLPPAIEALLSRLDAEGYSAHLVGPAVRTLLDDGRPRDFEVATSADGPALLSLLPKSVAIDPARARILLPTPAGPVDLVPHPPDRGIRGALAARDFTVHAVAADAEGAIVDPFGGRADLAASRLRSVDDPDACFAADPLRLLRAARWAATHDLAPEAPLYEALCRAPERLTQIAASRLRGELHALLLGRHVARGLALLRATGLEAALAEGVADDAADVVAALPPDLSLRLAGWLRGARVVRTLRRLREPRPRVNAIERLLQLHPIEAHAKPTQEARFARFVRRAGDRIPALLALREAEIAARGEDESARRRLEGLRRACEHALHPVVEPVHAELALGGREVMELLGCGPGPTVGRALAQLAKDVLADPSCNTRERLRERLLTWRAAQER